MFDLYVTYKLGKTLGIPLLRLVDVCSNSYTAYIEQMNPIPQNLAPNVNSSYCMDLCTVGSKLQKNNCWRFFL